MNNLWVVLKIKLLIFKEKILVKERNIYYETNNCCQNYRSIQTLKDTIKNPY